MELVDGRSSSSPSILHVHFLFTRATNRFELDSTRLVIDFLFFSFLFPQSPPVGDDNGRRRHVVGDGVADKPQVSG